MNWFIFSILATALFGIQSFLYKYANAKGTNKYLVTLVFMITVEVLALAAFILGGITITNLLITLFLGFLFALFFVLKTLGQFKALEYLPTNKVFPITSSNVILVVFYALIFFNESLSFFQVIGVILILLAINLIHSYSKKSSDYHSKRSGFLFAFLAIIPGAAMTITNKYAAISTDLSFFILVTYMFSIIISYSSYKLKKDNKKHDIKKSVKLGVVIGFVNFFGFLSLLTALKTGPLSLIAAIHSTYVIITVLLAKYVHKEKLSLQQFGLVILIIAGIVLLRI